MAMMAKMRSLAPAFIIGVGVIFVLFMVISDSNIMEVFGLRTNNVGSINGVKISYQEFNKAMETERENLKQQNGKDVSDEEGDQFKDQVWDALVSQTLVKQQIKKLGITVTDEEIRNVILGNNPPEFLKRNFVDSTGRFNRQLYLSALYDSRNSQPLLQAEDYIRQSLLNQKLQSMLFASVNISESNLREKFIEQSTKINDQFAFVNINQFSDASIKVTDIDLKNYYDKHIDQFVVKAQRKIKYVMFPTVPSAEDSSNVRMNLENVLSQSKNDTTSFRTLVETFSSRPYSKDSLSISALPLVGAEQIMNAAPGSIVGPFASPQGYALYHVLGVSNSGAPTVKVSHILINQFGDDAKNAEEAMNIYKELQGGKDFATLARQYSKDPGSATNGGDLGWFGKGRMVPEFEKAAFEGKVGVIQKPIKTNYGYHIIKVTGRSDKSYVVEQIISPIKASSSTKDQILNNAKDFSYIANKDGFEKEAQLMKYKIAVTPPFYKEMNFVPGIGASQNLIDFSFNSSLNSISDPIRTPNGYIIALVSEITKEGAKELKDIKEQVRRLVIREKKFEMAKQLIANVRSKINGDLSKASSIDQRVTVNQTGDFNPTGQIPVIGFDYNVTAKSLKLPVNSLSEPVKGNSGYYLIKVLSRTPFDASTYAVQRNSIRDSFLNQKRSMFFQEWLAKLKKDADIVDNRAQVLGQ
ncbi:MAG: peptidylprolyl isomerase [Ignavibacteriaceae bacterium]|nr:peptidylprolyl isomerase [Ignavibacteriaceae bacterium]